MTEPGEHRAGAEIEARLRSERPRPEPEFRSLLRDRLVAQEGEEQEERLAMPPRIGSLIGAYATCGAVLLAVAILGVLGSGPLAA